MALNAKTATGGGSSGPRMGPLEPGTYPARLVQLIDLGVQIQRPWKGEEKPPCQEMMTTVELVDEFMEDEDGKELLDKPRWLSTRFKLYSLDADKATSTKHINAIDPDGDADGDWVKLLGAPTSVSIKINKNDDRYNILSAFNPITKKVAKKMAPLVNDTSAIIFDDADTVDAYRALPDWIKEIIGKATNWKGSALQLAVVGSSESAEEEEADVEELDGEDAPW